MTWKGTCFSVFIVGSIGLYFSLYPDTWSSFFTDNNLIKETAKSYLEIVAPFYIFFALGLGLYFTCQAFNTLFWPVIGTLIRLLFVVIVTILLLYMNMASPYLLFITMSLGLIIYGTFIALSLHFGPWKNYYKS
jgi:Na+-driven multidrug efflux pump